MISIEKLSREDIEQQFIKTFILSIFQDRARYELASDKKRRHFFSRLSHNYMQVLKPELMIKIPRLRAEQKDSEIMSMLKARGAKNHCYVMSYSQEFDQKFLAIEEAIHLCTWSLEAILICHDKLAFLQTERVSASPPRFILTAGKMTSK